MKPSLTNKDEVIAYLTDCTLATVDDLAMKSKPSKRELRRQISIAQLGVDAMVTNNLLFSGRVEEVVTECEKSVEKYAKKITDKWNAIR